MIPCPCPALTSLVEMNLKNASLLLAVNVVAPRYGRSEVVDASNARRHGAPDPEQDSGSGSGSVFGKKQRAFDSYTVRGAPYKANSSILPVGDDSVPFEI